MPIQKPNGITDIRNMPPVDPTELEFDLGKHIHLLLREEPFFAKISRYIKKVPVRGIPTVGVRLNHDTLSFELCYNPKFFLGSSKTYSSLGFKA